MGSKRVLCPYCLAEIHYTVDIKQCPNTNCNKPLPIEYVREFEKAPPCFTQIMGWSSHGKTVYLQTLTAMLMRMGLVWKKNYEYSAQTDVTLTFTRQVKNYINTRTLPPGTQLGVQDAYIMQLNGMERWGSRSLVLHDVAGEFFNKLIIPVEYTPYLVHVPTTIMIISLDDLKQSSYTIDELLNSYIQTLLEKSPEFTKLPRQVVVALSKADLIIDELPDNIKNYLASDKLDGLLDGSREIVEMNSEDMHRYMSVLAKISDEIKDWIDKRDPTGHTMILRAEKKNIDLRFTVLSSTGGAVAEDKTTRFPIEPARVLDPFFWVLELQSSLR